MHKISFELKRAASTRFEVLLQGSGIPSEFINLILNLSRIRYETSLRISLKIFSTIHSWFFPDSSLDFYRNIYFIFFRCYPQNLHRELFLELSKGYFFSGGLHKFFSSESSFSKFTSRGFQRMYMLQDSQVWEVFDPGMLYSTMISWSVFSSEVSPGISPKEVFDICLGFPRETLHVTPWITHSGFQSWYFLIFSPGTPRSFFWDVFFKNIFKSFSGVFPF